MNHKWVSCLLVTLAVLCLAVALLPQASAETTRWQINYQHITLDVGSSGNVYMLYNVDADIVLGNWPEVWIPATTGNMRINSVVDGNGQAHDAYMDSGYIKVRGFDMRPGDHVTLYINSTLPGFVYSSDREGYDIVMFTPPWWDMTISDTMIKYLLPAEINASEVYTGTRQYSGIGTENGRTMVFFNSSKLTPNEQFDTAVSFPDRYMAAGAVTSKGGDSGVIGMPVDVGGAMGGLFGSMACCLPIIFVGFIIFVIFASVFRSPYSSPSLSMSGMGVNQNLDPVEAAMLLRVDPKRVLTMIMFGLLKKGNAKLLSTDPLRLELVSRKDLNYYEARFADAIKGDQLDEDKLLSCFKVLAQRVVDKTRPYSRKETEAFYRQKIDEMWNDVKAVDTPELKLQKYDTDMFWLMADEQFATKTTDSLRSPGWNTATIPPYYWWYPIYFGLPHGTTTTTAPTTGQPTTSTVSTPTNQTTSSVESFASKISNSVESTSAGIVGSVESFLGIRNAANAPPPATPATGGAPGGSCACVSCACACVSCACACACAGGGGGCT